MQRIVILWLRGPTREEGAAMKGRERRAVVLDDGNGSFGRPPKDEMSRVQMRRDGLTAHRA